MNTINQKIVSRLSFEPVFETWRKKITEHCEGVSEYFQTLLDKVAAIPELSGPIEDLSVLERHHKTIELILASVFPLTYSRDEDYFAVGVPFTYQTVHASRPFQRDFLNEAGMVTKLEDETAKNLSFQKLCGAYQLILNQLYGKKLSGGIVSVHPFRNQETGLVKYLQLEVDTGFVKVIAKGALPEIPEGLSNIQCADETDKLQQLIEILPISQFEFEGIVLINIKDVTEQQIITEIKNELLTLDSFTNENTFGVLQHHIENLIGSSGVRIGLTPFFKINRHFVLSDQHDTGSMLFKNLVTFKQKNSVYKQVERVFGDNDKLLVIPEITEETLKSYPFLHAIFAEGGNSVMICPLYNDRELLGTLEITSAEAGMLSEEFVTRLLPVIPLFVLALEKSAKNLANEIDSTIRKQFTAIQSSVEWRFTEAALKYLTDSHNNEEAKVEPIVFENVYPLYGAIDLRNSSTERNKAIQQDLIEQLTAVGAIIRKAQSASHLPLLDAIRFKIEKYISAVSNIMLSDDENAVYHFLKVEVTALFNHLLTNVPALQKDIEHYFAQVDTESDTWNRHRRDFEQSITYINNSIARFIDSEQQKAQEIFPHYFERFVTDGVDFNIYIGKSITPQKHFDAFYLKNLKMWQLTTLANAARLSRQLESRMAKPLQTTQLILAHGQPISISFRTAERKFDVDGAYNIRYEIIKKRIDKVHIKDSNERLTQPGKLAIVYSQASEAAEYMEYIEYLQGQHLLAGEVEQFELEELQGVSGLKALRVAIQMEDKAVEKKEVRKGVAKV